jgi:hypothetical protein
MRRRRIISLAMNLRLVDESRVGNEISSDDFSYHLRRRMERSGANRKAALRERQQRGSVMCRNALLGSLPLVW